MNIRRLERLLVRCRLLITRSALQRLGYRTGEDISKNKIRFIDECHSAYKKAAQILTSEMLTLQATLDRSAKEDDPGLIRDCEHWLRILEFAYDSFVWIAANHDRSNVTKIFKGVKYGSLLNQNINSVIETADELNTMSNVFAFPLDFSRFSCIGDLVRITRHPSGRVSLDFIEVKEGNLNERILDVILSKGEAGLSELHDQFGEKAVKQAERMLRQGQVAGQQLKRYDADPGMYSEPDENRFVSEMRVGPEDQFDDLIEVLMDRARQGEFSTEIIDDCLVVTALDATSKMRYTTTDFSSRAIVHARTYAGGRPSPANPETLADELQRINFIDWMEALNSAVCMPPLLRRTLSTRSFLDLMSGRIQLRFHFDAAGFLRECREQSLRAGFIKKKITSRLKASGHWKKDEYPIFQDRALGYIAGELAGVIGWGLLHEIFFNWKTPSAIARQIAYSSAELERLSKVTVDEDPNRNWFSERDLEEI